jgi:hypothetical protein
MAGALEVSLEVSLAEIPTYAEGRLRIIHEIGRSSISDALRGVRLQEQLCTMSPKYPCLIYLNTCFIDVQVAECSYPTSAKHSGPLDLVILYQGLVEPQSHVNTHEDR